LLGADRPVGSEAAEAAGEAVDDSVPEAAVDEVTMDEDDRLALAGLAVADPSGGQVDLAALIWLAHCILLGKCFRPMKLVNYIQTV
jgi:hypothetical protein